MQCEPSGEAMRIKFSGPGSGLGPRGSGGRSNWAVAAVFEVDIEDLRAPTRGSARTAFARQVAMYLAHVGCGVTLTEVGTLFARDRTTVAHACGVVEDRRDDPDLDLRLDHLERAVSSLIDALVDAPWTPMSRTDAKPQERARRRASARRLLAAARRQREARFAKRKAAICPGRSRAAASRQAAPRCRNASVEFCLRQDWLERSGQRSRSVRRRDGHGSAAPRRAAMPSASSISSGPRPLKEIDGTRRPVLVNEAESPLGWLKSRKDRNGRPLISDTQYRSRRTPPRRLLVRPSEPQGDGELVGARPIGPLAPRGTLRRRRLARRRHCRQGARHARARCRGTGARRRARRCLLRAEGPGRGREGARLAATGRQGRAADRAHASCPALRADRRRASCRGDGKPALRHWGSEDYRPTLDAWRGSGDQ